MTDGRPEDGAIAWRRSPKPGKTFVFVDADTGELIGTGTHVEMWVADESEYDD